MSDRPSSFDASDKQASHHSLELGSQNLEDSPWQSDRRGPPEAAAAHSEQYHASYARSYGRECYHFWPDSGTYHTTIEYQDEFSWGFQDWGSSLPSYSALSTPEQQPFPSSSDLFAQSGRDVAAPPYQSSAPRPTEREGFQWPQDTSQTDFIAISPASEDGPGSESRVHEQEVASSPSPEDTAPEATSSQQGETHGKRRKLSPKMHQCELCGKEFPRPSGLLIHMNSHTNERRYTCKLLSCGRSFNVLSNARRHYRTHGIEPPASLRASRRRGYVVNFEAPITPQLPPPSVPSQAPFQAEPDVDFDPRHQPVDKSW